MLCRGHPGPPHRRRDPPLRHRLRGPAAVGARREGGLGGPEAARPRDPHDGLAAPLRREVPRVRRLVHLPDGRGPVSMGFVAGLDYRDARFSVHDALQQLKAHPLVAEIIEGGKRVAWGAKTIPSGGYWARAQAALGAGHGDLRRRRRHGERPEAQGRPLRHARRHVRGRDDLRAAQGGRELRRPVELRGEGRGLGDRDGPVPLAQHAPAVRQGLLRGRRAWPT